MKEFHLHKDNYSKLQLDIHPAKNYCQKNDEHCFVPHRHSFFQIIWFKTPGRHHVDYKAFEHPENSVFFLLPGQVHHFCRDSDNDGYLLHFNDIFFQRQEQDKLNHLGYNIFNEIGEPFVILPDEEMSGFQRHTEVLIDEIDQKRFNYKEQLYHYLHIVFLTLERLKKQHLDGFETDQHFEVALKFKRLVNAHKTEFKPISFFSQALGISDKTLNLICKKHFRDTPATLIHKSRILEAKRLLSNTGLSKKEIAYQLGFDQQTYFTKYFKKYTSLTPKEFQQRFH